MTAVQEATPDPGGNNLAVFNYCASFIDLLGQRAALQGQGAVPQFNSEREREDFFAAVRGSVGSTKRLQTMAAELIGPLLTPNLSSPYRTQLAPGQIALWGEMLHTEVTTQRWSDGLVSFACLGNQGGVRCKTNNVFAILGQAGSICLLGLTVRIPVRGAIEIAWGVELHPGELYGAVIARAYELESEIAQYPRIVVGPRTEQFLRARSESSDRDIYSQTNAQLRVSVWRC